MPTHADLRALGGPLAGLSFVSGVALAVATARSPYPRPGASLEAVQAYFGDSAAAARISVVGQLLSSLALLPFTAAVVGLAGRTGDEARALQTAALIGGVIATTSLATAALSAAALTGPAGRHEASAIKLHRRVFLAGGPVHTAAFGLLVGILGLAGLRTGDLPRPLALTALASASAGLLALLTPFATPAVWFIPAGRFSGLLVSAIAGVLLAREPR